MNEGRTTLIFAAIAAVSLGLAWMSKPEAISDESDLKKERTGQSVFVKFEDPAEAASFQIIKYDEELGQLERFEVAKDKTSSMWKLPSYDDYPADAAEQVRDATTPLVSLPILDVPSLDRGDHSLYGVVNPDEEGLTVGETGVGMLLRVKDNTDQVLAELVVGKEVEGAEGQRYVRIPSEDAVYVVELSTAPFTTDFQKWINQELLEVRSFDIASIGLRDYAIVPTQQGYGMSRNFDADLSFDSAANKWSLDRLLTYEQGGPQEIGLAEGEALQETALNDLRNAVQDLQIVNVLRKPTGLAADLKADKSLMENKESLQSLVSQGFIPQESPAGTEIFATGGETLVGTQNGVKYLLRFGEVVAKLSGSEGEDESGLNRYLLVSAVLDEAKFPPPDLQPLPETVEEMLAMQKAEQEASAAPDAGSGPLEIINEFPAAPELPSASEPAATPESVPPASSEGKTETPETPATETPASETPASETPATEPAVNEPAAGAESTSEEPVKETATEETPAAETPVEPGSEDELNACGPQEQESTAGDEPSTTPESATDIPAKENAVEGDAQAQAKDAKAADAPPSEETKPVPAPAQAEAPEADSPVADKPADQPSDAPAPKTEEELKEELEFVREQIAKENQRKIDERNEKLEEARKRVQELNARFADWYYVVSDSVYRKLRISRDQLIKTADASAEGAEAAEASFPNADAFNLQP